MSDTDSTDCKQQVCDGNGNIVTGADDDDVPPGAAGQCYVWKCANQMATTAPANQGQACNAVYDVTCQAQPTCQGTMCVATNLPDSTFQVGACGTGSCQLGVYSLSLDDGACMDPNPSECTVPKCDGGNGTPTCGAAFLAQGTGCTKTNGFSGQCNNMGRCCNGYGCD
ncbi:MAG: hypothetical protein U0441_04530 [Polyangiaceae bacterium]